MRRAGRSVAMAPKGPHDPWEWVEGETAFARRRAILFPLLTAGTIGGYLYSLAISLGAPAGPFRGYPRSEIPAGIALAFTFASVVVLWTLDPGRRPVISRLGLSTLGLRIRVPGMFEQTVPWDQVREVGPDLIEVPGPVWGTQRYRLNRLQATRLHGYRAPPPPASLPPKSLVRNRPLPSR